MPYILFDTMMNAPLALVMADPLTADLDIHQIAIPCNPDADPNDITHWQEEAAKPATLPALADVQLSVTRKALAAADAAVAVYMSQFSEVERATWPAQQREVEALAINPDAPTPTLDALALNRGISREEQIIKAQDKVEIFVPLSAFIVGKQQGYEDQIKAIAADVSKTEVERIAELCALTFDFLPSAQPEEPALPQDTVPDTTPEV